MARRLVEERDQKIEALQFDADYNHVKNKDRQADRAALAAMYQRDINDKAALARKLREQQLREGDGVADRINEINQKEKDQLMQ